MVISQRLTPWPVRPPGSELKTRCDVEGGDRVLWWRTMWLRRMDFPSGFLMWWNFHHGIWWNFHHWWKYHLVSEACLSGPAWMYFALMQVFLSRTHNIDIWRWSIGAYDKWVRWSLCIFYWHGDHPDMSILEYMSLHAWKLNLERKTNSIEV